MREETEGPQTAKAEQRGERGERREMPAGDGERKRKRLGRAGLEVERGFGAVGHVSKSCKLLPYIYIVEYLYNLLLYLQLVYTNINILLWFNWSSIAELFTAHP